MLRRVLRYLPNKESFKGKYSTCKTSAGVNPASIFQRNPFKNFFHSIFFPGKSLVKNSKLTFNFTWKSPIKFFLHFFQGNPFTFFSKITLFRIFFKNPLQEGVFENSWKFFQLVPNLTPIRKLLCTFLYLCYCYP